MRRREREKEALEKIWALTCSPPAAVESGITSLKLDPSRDLF